MLLNLKRALKLLTEHLGWTAAVTISLGFGMAAAVLAVLVADNAWFRPLTYRAANRLVAISETSNKLTTAGRLPIRPGVYEDLKQKLNSYQTLGAFDVTSATLTEPGPPEDIDVARMSAGVLHVLEATTVLGRVFDTAEEQEPTGLVALISDDLWKARFARDPKVLGATIQLSGRKYRVIGVMPANFAFPRKHELPDRLRLSERERVQIWVPLVLTPAEKRSIGNWTLGVIGRLKPNATLRQAHEEVSSLCRALRTDRRDMYAQTDCSAHLLIADARDHSWAAAHVVLAAGGVFLLLMAGLNVACAVAARTMNRSAEFAVRAALGAAPVKILQQLFCEQLLVTLVAGVWGGCLTWISITTVIALAPPAFPRLSELHFDGRGVLALLGLVLLVACGLVAISYAYLRRSHDSCLQHRTDTGAGRSRTSNGMSAILVAQTALSLALVIGLGLMFRTYIRLSVVDKGFDSTNVLMCRLAVDAARHEGRTEWARFYENVVTQISSVSGVESVAVIDKPPLTGDADISDTVSQDRPDDAPIAAEFRRTTGLYFRTVGIPLVKGRAFAATDTAEAPPVALVNATLATRLWPGADPIGKVFKRENDRWRTVIGVVGDVRQASLDHSPRPQAYTPFTQTPWFSATIVVKSQGAGAADLPNRIRSAIWQLEPQQTISQVRTMDEHVALAVADRRFVLRMFEVFGLAAVILMATGIVAVTSYSVGIRMREIAIRIALGASTGKVQLQLLASALRVLGSGLCIGLLLGWVVSRQIRSLLFETEVAEPLLYAGAAAALAIVGTLAFYLPARRAAHVDPAHLLKTG